MDLSCNMFFQGLSDTVFFLYKQYYCKKRIIPVYLIKTVLKRSRKRTLNAITQHEERWLGWKGKLQVTLLSAFQKEIVLSNFQSLFGRGKCDVFWENERKMHEGGCLKEFFSLTCSLASGSVITDQLLHKRFLGIERLRLVTCFIKCLKSTCGIVFYWPGGWNSTTCT